MEIVIIKPEESKNHQGLAFTFNGEEAYRFTLDVERYDEMMEWIFEHTKCRFQFLGTDRVYFENTDDAFAFKMRWA